MPRVRQRVCLESGLKLDLNKLMRQRLLQPGCRVGPYYFRWTNTYTGEQVATALISANMGPQQGWLRIQLGNSDQSVDLVSQPRHFGGRQWYFECPGTYRPCTALWRPPGATRFCSRQAWGRRVGYASQFLDPDNRAHRGKAKIQARLIADLDPDEWELPPKPKWMRWSTYNQLVDRFESYEEILDCGIAELMAKWLGKYSQ
jgi:hypothetical protein